jgi:hypothetical protein
MFASLLRSAASLAASAVANELRKPENQEKLAAAARAAAAKARDPETMRALGRAYSKFKNR